MIDAKKRRIVVYDKEEYKGDGEWPPSNAMEFLAWFKGIIDSIPDEYKSSAIVELDSVGGYENSHYPSIKIYYYRQEAKEEVAKRVIEECKMRESRIEQLKLVLARLEKTE